MPVTDLQPDTSDFDSFTLESATVLGARFAWPETIVVPAGAVAATVSVVPLSVVAAVTVEGVTVKLGLTWEGGASEDVVLEAGDDWVEVRQK